MTSHDESIVVPVNKKRKLLTDFYTPSPKPPNDSKLPCPPKSTAVPGLTLHKDFITSDEEASILAFLDSKRCVWRTDLSRKTMHFGGEYCLMPSRSSISESKRNELNESVFARPQTIKAPPIPQELNWLIQRMIDRNIYPEKQRPQYCIVNCYTGNLGISAHTENFSFSQPVVGLSLLSPCPMRFHELVAPDGGSVRSGKAQVAKRTGKLVDIMLPGRSLVIMNDDARWKWQHEIVRTNKGRGPGWKRVSLTFRVT